MRRLIQRRLPSIHTLRHRTSRQDHDIATLGHLLPIFFGRRLQNVCQRRPFRPVTTSRLSLGVRPDRLRHRLLHLRTVKRRVRTRLITLTSNVGRRKDGNATHIVLRNLPITMVVSNQPQRRKPTIIRLPKRTARTMQAIATVYRRTPARAITLRRRPRMRRIFGLLQRQVVRTRNFLGRNVPCHTLLVNIRRKQLRLVVLKQDGNTGNFRLQGNLGTMLTRRTEGLLVWALRELLPMPHTPIVTITRLPTLQPTPINLRQQTFRMRTAQVGFFRLL